jgi:Uma2 family endonuclease
MSVATALESPKKVTVKELFEMELEEGYFYELLNGIIVKKQAPSPQHQIAVSNLLTYMNFHALSKRLGQCCTAPIDVFFDKYNNTQPDILFIKKSRQFIVTKNGIEGHPDLIVEVISPSSVRHDKVTKKALYLTFGVSEYWLVDPLYHTVDIYGLENNDYVLKSSAVEFGEVESLVLEGFKIEIKSIFESENSED